MCTQAGMGPWRESYTELEKERVVSEKEVKQMKGVYTVWMCVSKWLKQFSEAMWFYCTLHKWKISTLWWVPYRKAIRHLLSKANEVFMVGIDVGQLDINQQQNLSWKGHTEKHLSDLYIHTFTVHERVCVCVCLRVWKCVWACVCVLPGPWPCSLCLGCERSQFSRFPHAAWGKTPAEKRHKRNRYCVCYSSSICYTTSIRPFIHPPFSQK